MIDLQKFCAREHDPREHLRQPWDHRGFTYATNGHILVRVSCPDKADAVATHATADSAISLIDKAGKAGYAALPKNLPRPTKCLGCEGKGTYPQLQCSDCKGAGYFKHGRHEYDCRECDGEGWLPAEDAKEPGAVERDCPDCEGLGFYRYTWATVGDASYDAIYLRLLRALPGLLVCPNGPGQAMHFTFTGGEGLLMPRRAD